MSLTVCRDIIRESVADMTMDRRSFVTHPRLAPRVAYDPVFCAVAFDAPPCHGDDVVDLNQEFSVLPSRNVHMTGV